MSAAVGKGTDMGTTGAMTDLHDLELLLRSDTPIVLIETLEELRVMELAVRMNEPAFCWTVTEGLRRIDLDAGVQRHLAEPAEALRHVKLTPQRGIYLLIGSVDI
jgi:hypothetical protein